MDEDVPFALDASMALSPDASTSTLSDSSIHNSVPAAPCTDADASFPRDRLVDAGPKLSHAEDDDDSKLLLRIVHAHGPFHVQTRVRLDAWDAIATAYAAAGGRHGTSRMDVTRRLSELTLTLLETPERMATALRMMVLAFHERSFKAGFSQRLGAAFLTTLRDHATRGQTPSVLEGRQAGTDVALCEKALADERILELVLTHRPFEGSMGGKLAVWTTICNTFNATVQTPANSLHGLSLLKSAWAALQHVNAATKALLDPTIPYHAYLSPTLRVMLLQFQTLTANDAMAEAERRSLTLNHAPLRRQAGATTLETLRFDEFLMRTVLEKRPFEAGHGDKLPIWNEIASVMAAAGSDQVVNGRGAINHVTLLTKTMLAQPQTVPRAVRSMVLAYHEACDHEAGERTDRDNHTLDKLREIVRRMDASEPDIRTTTRTVAMTVDAARCGRGSPASRPPPPPSQDDEAVVCYVLDARPYLLSPPRVHQHRNASPVIDRRTQEQSSRLTWLVEVFHDREHQDHEKLSPALRSLLADYIQVDDATLQRKLASLYQLKPSAVKPGRIVLVRESLDDILLAEVLQACFTSGYSELAWQRVAENVNMRIGATVFTRGRVCRLRVKTLLALYWDRERVLKASEREKLQQLADVLQQPTHREQPHNNCLDQSLPEPVAMLSDRHESDLCGEGVVDISDVDGEQATSNCGSNGDAEVQSERESDLDSASASVTPPAQTPSTPDIIPLLTRQQQLLLEQFEAGVNRPAACDDPASNGSDPVSFPHSASKRTASPTVHLYGIDRLKRRRLSDADEQGEHDNETATNQIRFQVSSNEIIFRVPQLHEQLKRIQHRMETNPEAIPPMVQDLLVQYNSLLSSPTGDARPHSTVSDSAGASTPSVRTTASSSVSLASPDASEKAIEATETTTNKASSPPRITTERDTILVAALTQTSQLVNQIKLERQGFQMQQNVLVELLRSEREAQRLETQSLLDAIDRERKDRRDEFVAMTNLIARSLHATESEQRHEIRIEPNEQQ